MIDCWLFGGGQEGRGGKSRRWGGLGKGGEERVGGGGGRDRGGGELEENERSEW